MQLSPELQAKVRRLAHKYGHGWDGDDLSQDVFVVLWQLPESKAPQALTICRNICLDKLKAEKLRASQSLDFEPMLFGESVDVEKYIEHIENLRLRGIVDQYVDGQTALSGKDRAYLHLNRNQLDKDLRKYLKQKSPWQILIERIEPYRRSYRQLKEESVRMQMMRA